MSSICGVIGRSDKVTLRSSLGPDTLQPNRSLHKAACYHSVVFLTLQVPASHHGLLSHTIGSPAPAAKSVRLSRRLYAMLRLGRRTQRPQCLSLLLQRRLLWREKSWSFTLSDHSPPTGSQHQADEKTGQPRRAATKNVQARHCCRDRGGPVQH